MFLSTLGSFHKLPIAALWLPIAAYVLYILAAHSMLIASIFDRQLLLYVP